MRIPTMLFIGILLIGFATALEFSNPTLPKLTRPTATVSSCSCTSNGTSTGVNETYGDTLWMRLDQTNNGLISNNIDIQGYNLSSVDFLSVLNRIDTLQYNAQDGFQDYLTVNEWLNMTTGDIFGVKGLNMSGKQNMGNLVDAQKLLLYDSGTSKYGIGLQSAELRFFGASDTLAKINFGGVSTSDGTTYTTYFQVNTGSGTDRDVIVYPKVANVTVGTDRAFKIWKTVLGGASYPQVVEMRVGRWRTATAFSPETRLDFLLKNDSVNNGYADQLVMTLQSNGDAIVQNDIYGLRDVNVSRNVKATCIESEYEVVPFDDASTPPSGYYPQGSAVASGLRGGYSVMQNVTLKRVYVSSSVIVDCDTFVSRTVQMRFNITGTFSYPFNVTMNNTWYNYSNVNINLNPGDAILPFGEGGVCTSGTPLTNTQIGFVFKRRCS